MKRMLTLLVLTTAAMLALGCACSPKKAETTKEAEVAVATATQEPTAKPEATAEPEATPTESKVYQLGDKVDDFTVTLCDGTEVSLYGLLAEKKAVLLNFWATYCPPCRFEFPFMQEAYNQVSDDIGIIALSGWENDTNETVSAFKEELNLSALPMGWNTEVAARFNQGAIPTSVIIDKNGVVCFIEAKCIPETAKFLRLFSTFTAADYDEPVLLKKVPAALPNVESPSAEALTAGLNIKSDAIKVFASDNPYAWPFLPEKGSVTISNGAEMDSVAELVVTVELQEGEALAYEYSTKMEAMRDSLVVNMDGEPVAAYCDSTDWVAGYVTAPKAGTHTVTFVAKHDEFSLNDITMSLRNLRVLSAAELAKHKSSTEPAPAKTLNGTECEVTILAGDTKDAGLFVKVGDQNDDPVSCGVLLSDTATLHIKLGKDVNDDFAFITVGDNSFRVNTMKRDVDGYLFEYNKSMEPADTNMPLCELSVFPSVLTPNTEALLTYRWSNSEQDMDRFVEMLTSVLSNYGLENFSVSWSYSDGSERMTAPAEKSEQEGSTLIGKYQIAVTDEQGKPVEGVTLQICDDATCQLEKTDATGLVEMTMTPYPYEIHALIVPEGYERPTQTFTMPEQGGNLIIELKKQA